MFLQATILKLKPYAVGRASSDVGQMNDQEMSLEIEETFTEEDTVTEENAKTPDKASIQVGKQKKRNSPTTVIHGAI